MKALAHLNKYHWKYRRILLSGLLFIILTNLFNILAPFLVRVAFDYSYSEVLLYRYFKHTELGPNLRATIIQGAALFGLLILGVTLVRSFFMYLMRQTIIVVSRKIEYDLKNEIYSHYQQMSQSFYRKNFTGDLMSRLSEDVSKVRMYLGPAIMYFINLVFTFVMVLSMMLWVNTTMTLWVLLPLPFLSVSIYYVSKIINRKSDKIQAKLSDLTTFVQESMAGIRIVKAFSVQPFFADIFKKETESYRQASMSLTFVNSFFMPLVMFLVGLSTLITIYFGGMEVMRGTFTYGNIAEFVIYINMLTWPVASLGWVTAIVQSAEASQARINRFLEVRPEITSGDQADYSFEHNITLNHVSFEYEPNRPVLKSIQASVAKGLTVGILGPTGSGKTTLLNLISRFYDPTEGQICIDQHNIRSLDLREYRKLISYVPQEVFLFSETIADNIAFGTENPDQTSLVTIQKFAQIASVHQSIMRFKEGYNTRLGERGVTLSGGQKQRIALARALIRNPNILLLDDALSAVDQTTEITILKNLKAELQNKTAFIVSHRISVISEADVIWVLDQGRLVAQGTHQELLQSNTYYAKLYSKQTDSTN